MARTIGPDPDSPTMLSLIGDQISSLIGRQVATRPSHVQNPERQRQQEVMGIGSQDIKQFQLGQTVLNKIGNILNSDPYNILDISNIGLVKMSKINKFLAKTVGTTTKTKNAGWLLPDGIMIKSDMVVGYGTHGKIEEAFEQFMGGAKRKPQGGVWGPQKDMLDKTEGIRIRTGIDYVSQRPTLNLNMSTMPDSGQFARISEHIRSYPESKIIIELHRTGKESLNETMQSKTKFPVTGRLINKIEEYYK